MTYLPDELWLLVLPYCSRADAWLGLRPLNSQLRDCVEQYFADNVLSSVRLQLDVALPSYDVCLRLQGRAIFAHVPSKLPSKEIANPNHALSQEDEGRATWKLESTEQDDQYHAQVLARWDSLANASAHSLLPGSLDRRLIWKVPLRRGMSQIVLLPQGRIEWASSSDGRSDGTQTAQLSCEWRPMLTRLYREFTLAGETFSPYSGEVNRASQLYDDVFG